MKRNLYIEEQGDIIKELGEKGQVSKIDDEMRCLVKTYYTTLKHKLPNLFFCDLSFIDTERLCMFLKKARISKFVYSNSSTKAVDDISGFLIGGYRVSGCVDLEVFAGDSAYLSACKTGLIFERVYKK